MFRVVPSLHSSTPEISRVDIPRKPFFAGSQEQADGAGSEPGESTAGCCPSHAPAAGERD